MEKDKKWIKPGEFGDEEILNRPLKKHLDDNPSNTHKGFKKLLKKHIEDSSSHNLEEKISNYLDEHNNDNLSHNTLANLSEKQLQKHNDTFIHKQVIEEIEKSLNELLEEHEYSPISHQEFINQLFSVEIVNSILYTQGEEGKFYFSKEDRSIYLFKNGNFIEVANLSNAQTSEDQNYMEEIINSIQTNSILIDKYTATTCMDGNFLLTGQNQITILKNISHNRNYASTTANDTLGTDWFYLLKADYNLLTLTFNSYFPIPLQIPSIEFYEDFCNASIFSYTYDNEIKVILYRIFPNSFMLSSSEWDETNHFRILKFPISLSSYNKNSINTINSYFFSGDGVPISSPIIIKDSTDIIGFLVANFTLAQANLVLLDGSATNSETPIDLTNSGYVVVREFLNTDNAYSGINGFPLIATLSKTSGPSDMKLVAYSVSTFYDLSLRKKDFLTYNGIMEISPDMKILPNNQSAKTHIYHTEMLNFFDVTAFTINMEGSLSYDFLDLYFVASQIIVPQSNPNYYFGSDNISLTSNNPPYVIYGVSFLNETNFFIRNTKSVIIQDDFYQKLTFPENVLLTDKTKPISSPDYLHRYTDENINPKQKLTPNRRHISDVSPGGIIPLIVNKSTDNKKIFLDNYTALIVEMPNNFIRIPYSVKSKLGYFFSKNAIKNPDMGVIQIFSTFPGAPVYYDPYGNQKIAHYSYSTSNSHIFIARHPRYEGTSETSYISFNETHAFGTEIDNILKNKDLITRALISSLNLLREEDKGSGILPATTKAKGLPIAIFPIRKNIDFVTIKELIAFEVPTNYYGISGEELLPSIQQYDDFSCEIVHFGADIQYQNYTAYFTWEIENDCLIIMYNGTSSIVGGGGVSLAGASSALRSNLPNINPLLFILKLELTSGQIKQEVLSTFLYVFRYDESSFYW